MDPLIPDQMRRQLARVCVDVDFDVATPSPSQSQSPSAFRVASFDTSTLNLYQSANDVNIWYMSMGGFVSSVNPIAASSAAFVDGGGRGGGGGGYFYNDDDAFRALQLTATKLAALVRDRAAAVAVTATKTAATKTATKTATATTKTATLALLTKPPPVPAQIFSCSSGSSWYADVVSLST